MRIISASLSGPANLNWATPASKRPQAIPIATLIANLGHMMQAIVTLAEISVVVIMAATLAAVILVGITEIRSRELIMKC